MKLWLKEIKEIFHWRNQTEGKLEDKEKKLSIILKLKDQEHWIDLRISLILILNLKIFKKFKKKLAR